MDVEEGAHHYVQFEKNRQKYFAINYKELIGYPSTKQKFYEFV